jgi:hypothetical protein
VNTLQITIAIKADATPFLRDFVEAGWSHEDAARTVKETAEKNAVEAIKRTFAGASCEITSTATL